MMIKPIDNLINMNAEYNVDLIRNLSLSKNASCIKYALAYKDFNPKNDYGIINKETTFKPTEKWWRYKVDSYNEQDMKKNRDIKNNVQYEDYEWINELLSSEDSKCYICGEHFTYKNKPTLDRIDNSKGHSKDNVKLCCQSCNVMRNRKDEKIVRLEIQLRKYCVMNGLPMTITDENEYYELRNNITGGLSNVMHRLNIKGETKINKMKYDSGKVISYDTNNVMTHVIGVDFNSLYPSAFSSQHHPSNPYHGGKMYMPGRLIDRIEIKTDKQKKYAYDIIYNQNRFDNKRPKHLFKATVKIECPTDLINKFINFPPIFRNINIKNEESVIGSFMYSYMKNNHFPSIDKEERKLTMLIDTCGEYMTFSNYYLWFLIDHGLKIVDIKSISLYTAHDGFNNFVNEFMGKRIEILGGKVQGNEKFYKISMNGSYGYDGMNTEKYNKIKFCNKSKTYQAIISDTYLNARKIADNIYLVNQQPKNYKCKTCLQEAFWTLDNAKFWYLTFIYDFMNKCLDMDKIHFVEGDTDSCYWAVAGNINEPNTQQFNYVIKDKEFYDKHKYLWFPDPDKGITNEKKILGLAIEKQGDSCVALSPKCYTIWSNENTISLKLKGVSLKKNNIVSNDYLDILQNRNIKKGKNINLQMKNGTMSKISVVKNALTGLHTKMIVLSNQCCAPFIKGINANDYVIE